MSKLICFFLIMMFIISCGVKKTSTTYHYNSPQEIEEIIAMVEKNNNSTCDWMIINGQLDITQQDRKINVRINIKSNKDSVIWASVRGPFGVELIRGKITQDSVYFINRIKKTYFIDETNDNLKLLLNKKELEFEFLESEKNTAIHYLGLSYNIPTSTENLSQVKKDSNIIYSPGIGL